MFSRFNESNSQGKVEKKIGPGSHQRGQIYFQGGWWTACCQNPHITLSPGQFCRVVGRESITLLVEPLALAGV